MNKIIVFEQRGAWAAALKLALANPLTRIVEVRTRDECSEQLRRTGRGLVVVELTRNGSGGLLSWLSQLSAIAPSVAFAVVAERGLEALEPTLRGWGAIFVTTSPRQLMPLVAVIRRLSELATSECPENLRSEIWERLPWPGVATKA